LTWSPTHASGLGVVLQSSDTTKVRIRDGLLEAVWVGNAQVTATVRSDSRAAAFIVKVVAEGEPVTGISADDLVMRVGEEASPVLSWLPVDATYREYILSIDSPHVAKVSGGRIKALSPGVAKVLVEALDGGHRGAFTLTVKDIPLQVEAVSALVEDMYLLAGGPAESPIVHWTPSNVSRKAWLLAPVNSEVAEVSKEGDQVVPLKQGKTGMTFYSLDGSGLRASFTVHVTDDPVPVKGIAATDLKLTRGGDPTPPRLAWTPAEATDRRYALTTDNPLVADIAGNLIVPLDTGAANLTVVTRDGSLSDTFRVEVAVPDTAIHVDSLRALDMTLTVGSRSRPTLDWFPANAFNRKYTLTSSNPQVAAADSESVLAVAQGSADFTVVTSDGGHKATFRVGVGRILVQRVTAEDMSMLAGAEAEPSLAFVPADASDRSYTLHSLDTSIVTITSNSTVLWALQVGNAKVVVRSKDGPMDTLMVTVLARAIPVTHLDVPPLTLNVVDPVDRDVAPSIVWEPT
ncbi:MAG TPA: hypothetical protein VK465_15800, partial [Fibrobacteria bacterium]|nr:hypothetical protein [Fibrobacteria bacterium]